MAHPLTAIKDFTYQALDKELALTPDEKKNLDEMLKAYLDDFWQDGHGSLLPNTTGSNASILNKAFEKRFVFRNVIRECTARVAGAFYGKAPNWKFKVGGQSVDRPKLEEIAAPDSGTTEGGEPAIDQALTEIDKALGDFWTKQNVANVLSAAFEFRLAFGRGGIRIYIPLKYKEKNKVDTTSQGDTEAPTPETGEDTFVLFPDIPSALAAMRVEFVPPTQARQLDDGGELFSIVRYDVRQDWQTTDMVKVIEFSFVDNNEITFLGTVKENDKSVDIRNPANLSSGFDLGGATTYNEFKGLPYITKALYKNNQLLNLALTCAGFNLVDNGFGEMVLTNVELETETVTGADGESVEIPKKIVRGGGATQNFIGIESIDEATGATTRATPGVTFKQPTPMDAFKAGADLAYRNCLAEAGQLYALISGDATASGESRIQALADFILKIVKYKPDVDEQGSWVMTTALLWAAALSGQTLAEQTSIVYDSRMHVASLSSDEKRLVMDMRKDGAISRETERVLLGIDDPALEAELVLREQETPLEEMTTEDFSEKLDVALKMSGVGVDQREILLYLGYSEEEIAAMEQAAAERDAALLAQVNAGGPGDVPPQDAGFATGVGG